MKQHTMKALTIAVSLAMLAVLFEVPVSTHHSFAMYDQNKTVTLTGVVRQFVAQANHAELHFVLVAPDRKGLAKGADGKYVEWGVEMAGAAAVAQQGITTSTFASVPDVPISSFEVNLPQGPHSALTENLPKKSKGNFCSGKLVMPTAITAQNGLQIKQNTRITVTGCPRIKARKAGARSRRRR